jgi:uncharacterized protein
VNADIGQRLAGLDWPTIQQALHNDGCALTPALLTGSECDALREMYASPEAFRSHIVMARYRFGRGDYKYFSYPLPRIVRELREQSYPHLVPVADSWNEQLGTAERFPATHAAFLAACKKAGQTRATPLLLHYEAGDFNCLHQDLYGAVAFPLQLTCFLSRPGLDYEGGEFVLVEQQPRAQSRARVIAAGQGQILIFVTRYRPVKGSRGYYRTNLRHGVSEVKRGVRFALGVIYHDAE